MNMNDINVVTITGRLARKPEVRVTPSGVSVADVVVANHRWMKTGGEKTSFVRCALWNKQAEYAGSKLDIGDQVLINGQLVDDNYLPEGQEKPTRGRLKLDNCRVQIIAKANGTKAESTPAVIESEDDVDQSDPQATFVRFMADVVDPEARAAAIKAANAVYAKHGGGPGPGNPNPVPYFIKE